MPIIASVANTVCPVNPVTHRREIRVIPTWVEKMIGAANYNEFCPSALTLKEDHHWSEVTQRVGKRLAAVCDRKELAYEFRVKKDGQTINAFCLPGGKVAITTALLARLEKEKVGDAELDALTFEDKLAGVLGHEITHACAAHGAKRLQLGLFFLVIGKVVHVVLNRVVFQQKSEQRDQAIDLGWMGATFFLTQAHSRQHELQSDRIGMKYAFRAGFDPRGALFVQKLFIKLFHENQESDWLQQAQGLMQSHPPSHDRASALEALIAQGNYEAIAGERATERG
ncbi:MAG: M48 family metalloprotease [Chlamydiia bacterium]|nr:M48 family metalloprotease [Chlamydiia bacterium]